MFPSASAVALSAAFLVSAALTQRAWTPPNASPTGPPSTLPQDSLNIAWRSAQIRRRVMGVLWLLHVIVTVFYPSPPSMLCPNPDNLSPALFTWNTYTAAIITIIAVAAPIRLLAFRQLGENFTFRLTKPKKLVTAGLYRYVQHPSYPTNWLIMVVNIALLLRLDGVVGCVLPGKVVKYATGSGMWPTVLIGIGVLAGWGVWARVKDEEAMLKDEFGKEWEEYHTRTKRFIPWAI